MSNVSALEIWVNSSATRGKGNGTFADPFSVNEAAPAVETAVRAGVKEIIVRVWGTFKPDFLNRLTGIKTPPGTTITVDGS